MLGEPSHRRLKRPLGPFPMRPRQLIDQPTKMDSRGQFSEGAAHFFPPRPASSRLFNPMRPVTFPGVLYYVTSRGDRRGR